MLVFERPRDHARVIWIPAGAFIQHAYAREWTDEAGLARCASPGFRDRRDGGHGAPVRRVHERERSRRRRAGPRPRHPGRERPRKSTASGGRARVATSCRSSGRRDGARSPTRSGSAATQRSRPSGEGCGRERRLDLPLGFRPSRRDARQFPPLRARHADAVPLLSRWRESVRRLRHGQQACTRRVYPEGRDGRGAAARDDPRRELGLRRIR
jgi:hypothetical protein